ncbi:GPO family capsid scaffolding protein [Sphingomonas jatrophae]|uniref:Phage capsid scaffolding protein (GPO) serine peptidase n=1 Tax=Sphingomonas jatrophae TaxID=1166337 RepID=A0A1I6JLI4_9SPHN|nr:GPO family capsid scaffolding protein [Sphingomonas jatrophae]SFR79835.1 Phage capsid scaffolding protein (GPO) serine peptidase [Sphingomonas jatrophae]
MAKTKFFRVAVEGATTDGRVIERDWIDQMAAGYNPETYTARINCEHLRGFSPDKPFNAYGSIVAVKAEDFALQLDGKSQTRRALYAQFDVNDQLVEINRAGQKLFSSVEIAPNFAATGKAGLVGLAVTDNPASLGTEMLAFSAAKPMIDGFKSKPDSLISASVEFAFELEQAEPDAATGAFAAMKTFFERFTTSTPAPATPVAPAPAGTPPATPPANDNFAQLAEGIRLLGAGVTALSTKLDTDVGVLRTELGTLKTQLGSTEQPGGTRPPATGAEASKYATDC